MALDTSGLQTGLLALYNDAKAHNQTESSFATGMANLLTTFVQSGAVSVSTPGVQAGGSTLPGTGTIA